MSQPCFPIEGLDIEHYFSKEEFLTVTVEVLWKERLEKLDQKVSAQSGGNKPIPAKPIKKIRRKGGISL
jgi:hypothetical protein